MTVATNNHILLDDRGIAYIAGTTTRVLMVVADKLNGMTAEEILASYPYLSLAQIYAAFTFYYDHKDEMDAQLSRELERVAQLRQMAVDTAQQPKRQELQNRLKRRNENS